MTRQMDGCIGTGQVCKTAAPAEETLTLLTSKTHRPGSLDCACTLIYASSKVKDDSKFKTHCFTQIMVYIAYLCIRH